MGKPKKITTTLSTSDFFTGDSKSSLPTEPTGREYYSGSGRGGFRDYKDRGYGDRSGGYDTAPSASDNWRKPANSGPSQGVDRRYDGQREFRRQDVRVGNDSHLSRSDFGTRSTGAAAPRNVYGSALRKPDGAPTNPRSGAWTPSIFRENDKAGAKSPNAAVSKSPEPQSVNELAAAMEDGQSVSLEVLKKNINQINMGDEYERSCVIRCVASSLSENRFNLQQFVGATRNVKSNFPELFEGVLSQLLKNQVKLADNERLGNEKFLMLITDAGIDFLSLLGLEAVQGEDLLKALSQRGLSILMPVELKQMKVEIEKVAKVEDVKPAKDSVDVALASSPNSTELMALVQNSALDQGKVVKICEYVFTDVFKSKNFENYSKLLLCFTKEFGTSVLNGVQAGWDRAGRPGNKAAKNVFEQLDEHQLISPESFIAWRDSSDNQNEAKKKMLFQVTAFLSEIMQRLAEPEDEEEEEEEEEAEY